MNILSIVDFREPVNAWTHFLGFLLAWPAAFLLLRRAGNCSLRRTAFSLFGFGLVACYLGSTLYHGMRVTPEQLRLFHTMDYVGIYLLIAGSVTPVALVLLRGTWRWGLLGSVWVLALVGIYLQIFFSYLPSLLAVGLYLLMGWSVILALFELARVVPRRALHLAILGGVVYTVGAGIHVSGWPVIAPGVFGSHELFHVFVLAGTACHFLFMLLVVAPFTPAPLWAQPVVAATSPLAKALSGARAVSG